eukprot:s1410_g4.t1
MNPNESTTRRLETLRGLLQEAQSDDFVHSCTDGKPVSRYLSVLDKSKAALTRLFAAIYGLDAEIPKQLAVACCRLVFLWCTGVVGFQ